MGMGMKSKMEIHKLIRENSQLNSGKYSSQGTNVSYCTRRIVEAIDNREKILIFGYHDIDKIASISILILVLKYLNADVEYYMPNDIRDGEHLTYKDIKDHIKYLGTKLIISVGGLLESKMEAELCRSLSMDLIVLSNNQEARGIYGCLVKPNCKCSNGECTELSYSGVTYKLVKQLGVYYKTNMFNKYIDLVCLGTIASKNRIIGNNISIVKKGIDRINNTRNYGLIAIKDMYNIHMIDINSVEIIANCLKPKINAMGNMDDAKIIVELFTTSDVCKAKQIVKYIQG